MKQASDVKKDFPIFTYQPELVYLDSAATALKPQMVIDALNEYYREYTANIHRGIYHNAEKASERYEAVRTDVAGFIHANNQSEISFSKNATESLNLLAYTIGETLQKNDEIVVTIAEHHANFVPWQQITKRKGSRFRVLLINDEGKFIGEYGKPIEKNWDWTTIISKKTKVFAMTHVSNVLGTLFPVKEYISVVKKINSSVICVVDGCQAIVHQNVDVQDLGADAYVFSSHKLFGPTGVGVLWAKLALLESLPPFLFGGDMITKVMVERTEFKSPPHRFEAGTPPIGEVIGLGAAIRYRLQLPWQTVVAHEKKLIQYTYEALVNTFSKKITILGTKNVDKRSGLIAFSLNGIHPHDIAQVLDEYHVCIRAGHHCAMPLHNYHHLTATARISFGAYNQKSDIDQCIVALQKAKQLFGSYVNIR